MSTPNPGTTPWVPMWNLNGGMDLRYQGDWAAGNYYDGDVVVYNGVLYMCVRPTSAAPKQWVQGITTQGPSVRVYRSTQQSIPSGGWNAISFDSVRWDRGPSLHWSASQPTRLTCQVAGTYVVWGGTEFYNAAAGIARACSIWLNGANNFQVYGGTHGFTPTSGGYPPAQASNILQLNVGDYIEFVVQQDSGAALNTVASDAGSNRYGAEFSMALVGGVPGPQAQLASYGTQLPSNPTDGQEHVLVDSTTNPSYQWKFRYNAGSTSAYKWEFVGGAPAINTVDTQEMTTSQTFVNLATVGPQLAIPRDGEYEISWGAGIQALSSGVAYMGIRFGAAATNNNDVVYMYQGTSTAIETNAARTRKYTLVAGSGVPPGGGIGTAYRNNNNTTQCYFAYRWLRVQPVRIS